MSATLEAELSKLSVEQKLQLIDRLWADVEKSGLPAGIWSEDDAGLEAELQRRLREAKAHPEQWLTLEEFKRSLGDK